MRRVLDFIRLTSALEPTGVAIHIWWCCGYVNIEIHEQVNLIQNIQHLHINKIIYKLIFIGIETQVGALLFSVVPQDNIPTQIYKIKLCVKQYMCLWHYNF